MKQKNLILMVVAIGCGLIAAFLTSQMSAKPKNQETVLVDVLVASKQLDPGTRFTKDSLKDQVKRKKYKPDEVPENAITDEGELIDRQLTKTLRADDYVGGGDLGLYKPLEPPPGKDLISVRMVTEGTTPFLKPGSRIDIIGTGVTRRNQVVGIMILPNMLVMAEGIEVRAPDGSASGKINIQLVTIAVSTEEALLIRMCQTAGVQLSFILRSEEAGMRDPTKGWNRESVNKWLGDLQGGEGLGGLAAGAGDRPQAQGQPDGVNKVKLPVPTEDLPAGTAITDELVQQKFKDVEFVAPIPENAVTNMKEHLGRFLIEKVAANQFVPKTYIGEKPKPAPQPQETKPDPKKAPPKEKETLDRSITTPAGTKWYRYEKQADGEYKLIGEVKEDGTVVPVQGNAPPTKPKEDPPGGGLIQPADPKQLT